MAQALKVTAPHTMYTHATLSPMTTKATPQKQGTTKMVRVTLSDGGWRRLRLKAADENVSLTHVVNGILERESARIAIRKLTAQTGASHSTRQGGEG